MTIHGVAAPRALPGAPPASDAERLRATARQMEGVFVQQMFKTMRETVPEGSLTSGGAGEEMFAGLLDQHLADQVPDRWQSGLSDALYRQLSARIRGAEPASGPLPAAEKPDS